MNKESIKIIKRVVLAVVLLVILLIVVNIKPVINAMIPLDIEQKQSSFGLTDIFFVLVMVVISSIFLMFLFNEQGLIVKSQPPKQEKINNLNVRRFTPEELMPRPAEKPYKKIIEQIQPLREMIKKEDTKIIGELRGEKPLKQQEAPKEDYISLLPKPKEKYALRTVKLISREDFLQTLNSVRESNSVLFVDVNKFAKHDPDLLKRYLNKLKTTSDVTNSQIAFLSKTHLVIVPPFAEIYRKK